MGNNKYTIPSEQTLLKIEADFDELVYICQKNGMKSIGMYCDLYNRILRKRLRAKYNVKYTKNYIFFINEPKSNSKRINSFYTKFKKLFAPPPVREGCSTCGRFEIHGNGLCFECFKYDRDCRDFDDDLEHLRYQL